VGKDKNVEITLLKNNMYMIFQKKRNFKNMSCGKISGYLDLVGDVCVWGGGGGGLGKVEMFASLENQRKFSQVKG
jgi:hypothetical protein